MKKKENDMWYPPYPMPYPTGNNEDPLIMYQRYRDFFDKMAKETEEKKKNDSKKKPEPRKFTFLETFGLCVFLGPILGFSYLFLVKAALIQVELWFK